jgi:hypothetical protein
MVLTMTAQCLLPSFSFLEMTEVARSMMLSKFYSSIAVGCCYRCPRKEKLSRFLAVAVGGGGVQWVLQRARLPANGDTTSRVEQARSDGKRTERNNEPFIYV